MKKLVLLIVFVALLVVALQHLDRNGLHAARYATLPFKVAMLSAKEADRELAVPVEGVSVKRINNSWHAPRLGGRLHEGQDIFAARGTAVRSATAGYVVRLGENSLGGNTIFVAGAGGRTYYYAHLDSYAPALAPGDYVTPDTILGYVGTTGNAAATSPHLHFGIYTAAGPLDPLPLLTDRPQPPQPTQTSKTR